jgi:hypothetical protein
MEDNFLIQEGEKRRPVKYFGKHNNSNYGFEYQDISTKIGIKMMADSFQTFRELKGLNSGNVAQVYGKIVDRKYDEAGNIIKETYCEKLRASAVPSGKIPLPDSVYVSYNKNLIWTNITLTNSLDSLNHSKVSKIVLQHNAGFRKEYNKAFPVAQYIFEITEQPVENSQQIKALFRTLEDDYKSSLSAKKPKKGRSM